MKVSIFTHLLSARTLSGVMLASCMLLFMACGSNIDIPVYDPLEKKGDGPKIDGDYGSPLFPGGKPGTNPVYPKAVHLKDCSDGSACEGGTSCLRLSGASACFFKCDPKNGEGEVQNPDCIAPENCIRLNNGEGVCIFFPGQLYGSGSYKGLIRHKPQAKCLLRYGGCQEGYLCVDTKNDGSIGTCEEKCQPATHSASKNQPKCNTPNTKCKSLASGVGACLP